MVVLENAAMLTAGNNQYLQPDYLSSMPSQLDSKKSPLALLAQTCSSIGSDSSKPIPSEKKKEEDIKKEKSTPVETTRRSPAFKPYENTTKRESVVSSDSEEKANGTKTPSRDSSSVRSPSNSSSSERTKDEGGRTSREAATSSASTTPIIRSGLEVLAGYPKDLPLGTYRSGLPQSLLPPGYPGLENHPAFRGAHPSLLASLYPTTLSSMYQSQATAAALSTTAGLCAPSTTPSLLSSPYLSYTRVKVAGGGETVVPVCRDPYCTGCAYSIQNNHLLQSNGTCPSTCTQCEQAKAALSALPGLSSLPASSIVPASTLLPPSSPTASAAAAAAAAASAASLYPPSSASSLLSGPPRPYVCNWIAGDAYCGKRYTTSEELLQHLRTHTSVSADSISPSLLSNPLQAHAALYGAHSAAHSALAGHRASLYSPGAMSPLTAAAAARYHPYAKPPSALSSLGVSALAPTLPGLSPYSSPLSAYPPGFPSPYAGLYPRL